MCPQVCPQMPPDVTGWLWTLMDMKSNENPVITGLCGASWTMLDFSLVEAAGVEPASASTLPLALHA